jgi:hypothetical protein
VQDKFCQEIISDSERPQEVAMKDYSELLKVLKQASLFDVFVISFLLLPFLLQGWLEVLTKLAFTDTERFWSVGVIILLYVIGVIAMLVANNRNKKCEVAKDQVVAYLQSKQRTAVSFEKIRERISPSYNDAFLESLTTAFPQELRRARLKGGRRGLGRIIEETADET